MTTEQDQSDSKSSGDEKTPAAFKKQDKSSQHKISLCSNFIHKNLIPKKTLRQLKFRCSLHNTILDLLRDRGYKETENDNDWDIFWADRHWIKQEMDQVHLEDHQRVNHFRNHYELTRKDLMAKNLKKMKRQLEREDKKEESKRYNFIPTTFVVPAEYGLFAEEFKRSPGIYIMKPIGKAQGKGIFLFNKISQINDWKKEFTYRQDSPQQESYIVQKYIENPYLIGGKKFDLRIYALVTSYSPLVVYLHRNGFARFTFHKFTLNVKDIDNNYIHLTNVAIQKTSEQYDSKGCKWQIRQLKMFMASKHGEEAVEKCFNAIREIILRSLLAVQKVIIHDKHCFEMYGYDILIDQNLQPWLLEVNASPSLTADTKADYALKHDLLDDVLTVIDLEKRLSGKEDQIGGFDLIYRGVSQAQNSANNSNNATMTQKQVTFNSMESNIPCLLGTHYDREKQLRKMFKQSLKDKPAEPAPKK